MALSIEQLESWQKEATIHLDKLHEVDEMINRKLVDKNLAKRMGTVAEDNLQILISKLRNSLEGTEISEVCDVLDKIKKREADSVIKDDFQKIVKERDNDHSCIEKIIHHDGHILLLAMEVVKKLLA